MQRLRIHRKKQSRRKYANDVRSRVSLLLEREAIERKSSEAVLADGQPPTLATCFSAGEHVQRELAVGFSGNDIAFEAPYCRHLLKRGAVREVVLRIPVLALTGTVDMDVPNVEEDAAVFIGQCLVGQDRELNLPLFLTYVPRPTDASMRPNLRISE